MKRISNVMFDVEFIFFLSPLLPSLPSYLISLSLALVDDNTLLIGSVDQIQMLHIQTIPLGETARYIDIYRMVENFREVFNFGDFGKGRQIKNSPN